MFYGYSYRLRLVRYQGLWDELVTLCKRENQNKHFLF